MTDSLSGFTGHHVTHAEEPPPEPSHRASEATRRYEFRRSGTDECIQWIFDRETLGNLRNQALDAHPTSNSLGFHPRLGFRWKIERHRHGSIWVHVGHGLRCPGPALR